MTGTPTPRRPDLRRKALPLAAIALGMLGMAWAAVPLYGLFCRVTGYGGTTQVAEKAAAQILDRIITVRFDASTDRSMPWEFRPLQTELKLKIGETGLAFYEAYNPTDRVVAGSATYNVAPFSMGGYFAKIDCFCFTEQVLQPGERVTMPVTFYVDPERVDDREANRVTTVTLSYTFFETKLDSQAALSQTAAKAGVN
jgi:cytochrome c oxidase assembly protein subunit 11